MVAAFEPTKLRELSSVLGHTNEGLSNREIEDLLAACQFEDPKPDAPTGY